MKKRKYLKSVMSLFLVFAMVLGMCGTALAAGAGGAGGAEKQKSYVSLGASNVNGYGLRGYIPVNDDTMDAAALNSNLKADLNVLGYTSETPGSYPVLIADKLGYDLEQLAISSMRVEELRILLDNEYYGDAYSRWRFTDGDNWFNIATKLTGGQGGVDELREDYQTKIRNADLVTVDIGVNNFGVYVSYQLTDKYSLDEDLALIDPALAEQFEAGKAYVKQLIAENVSAEYAATLAGMEELVDTLAYALVGFCTNFDIVMEKIYDLNPDAKVVAISIQNLMDGLYVVVPGVEEPLPLGDLFGALINAANTYIAVGSPYADQYLCADVRQDGRVEFFLDDILAYDGDPASLSQNIIDCFDVYDGNPGTPYTKGIHIKYALHAYLNEEWETSIAPSIFGEYTSVVLSFYDDFDKFMAAGKDSFAELSKTISASYISELAPAYQRVSASYQNALNTAYDVLASILQGAAEKYVIDMGALEFMSRIEGALVTAIMSELETAVGAALGGTITGSDYTLPEGFFEAVAAAAGVPESAIETVAALAVRTSIGNSFFGHPNPDGHQQIADAVLATLEDNTTGGDIMDEEIANAIEDIYAFVLEHYDEAYAYAYAYAQENGYIDLAKGYIDEASDAILAADNFVHLAKVPAELENTRDLLQQELANTLETLAEAKELLDIDELTEENVQKILDMETQLYIHLDTIEKLADELGIVVDIYVEDTTVAAEYYAALIEEIVTDAYYYVAAGAEGFVDAYAEFVENVGSAADVLSPALGDAVRDYLTETPEEALAIMYAAGEDAIDEFVAAAIAVSNDVDVIIAAVSTVLEGDVSALVNAIEESEEVAAITARIDMVKANLEKLYEDFRKAPVTEALAYEQKISMAEAQLITLQNELVDAVISIIDTEISPAAGDMVEKAIFALKNAIETAEAAGEQYGEWFAGRFDEMVGDLLTMIIKNTEEFGAIAVPIVNTLIKDFIEGVKTDIKDVVDETIEDVEDIISSIEIPDIDLSEIDAIIEQLKTTASDIRAQIKALKQFAGDEVGAMIEELEIALERIEAYADELQKLKADIEDLVNKIEDETELTVEKVKTVVAQAQAIAAEAQAIVAETQAALVILGEMYEVVMPQIVAAIESIDDEAPAKIVIETTGMELDEFIATVVSSYETTVAAVEIAAANIEVIVDDAVVAVCESVAAAVESITGATEIAAEDIIAAAGAAVDTIKAEAIVLAASADADIAAAGKQILAAVETLEFGYSEAALIEKRAEIEAIVTSVIAALESVETVKDAEAVLGQAVAALEALGDIAEDIYAIAEGDVAAVLGEVNICAQDIKEAVKTAAGSIGADTAAAYGASAAAIIAAAGTTIDAVEIAVAAYEAAVVTAAGEIATMVSEAAAAIGGEVTTAVGTAVASIEAAVGQAEGGIDAIIDACEYALYDATHGEYSVDGDSYYVSLGDSTVTGMGADYGVNPEGYENYGYKTVVPASFPYKLAEELGLDVETQYIQLALAGLRTNDLLYVLDETFTPDEYFTNRVLNYINDYAGGLDAMRATYKEELAKADLVTLSIGNCNFTGIMECGIITKWINEDEELGAWLDNPYFGSAIKQAITDLGINLNAPCYAADWDTYLSDEEQEILYAAIEEIKATLVENGVPEIYPVDVGVLLEMPLNPGTIVIHVPVADLIGQFVEWYAYCYATHAFTYGKVLDKLHEMTQPGAEIVVVGMFNPMDELVITYEDMKLPVGEYVNYVLGALNLSGFAYAMLNPNTTYVSVPDVESTADWDMAQNGNTFELLEFISKYAVEAEGNFTNHHETVAGHEYIKDQILNALDVTVNGLLGDADNNGVVNMLDAVKTLKYFVNNGDPAYELDISLALADVTGDGVVNMMDAVQILKYFVNNGDPAYNNTYGIGLPA